jgi:hypothetical protein
MDLPYYDKVGKSTPISLYGCRGTQGWTPGSLKVALANLAPWLASMQSSGSRQPTLS